jgi:hypothetical protein
MDATNVDWQRSAASWQMVTMGIALPRSYVCLCCLTTTGIGMNHGTVTYCLRCWEAHLANEPCEHEWLGIREHQLAS